MPNSRRRKFSVQHNIIQSNNANSIQNGSQSSSTTSTRKTTSQTPIPNNFKNKRNLSQPSKLVVALDDVIECNNCNSMPPVKKDLVDKDVTASSSNIDLIHMLRDESMDTVQSDFSTNFVDRRDLGKGMRHEKFLRQHRAKVRSPKRRMGATDNRINGPSEPDYVTVALNAIDWDQEMEECVYEPSVEEPTGRVANERVSNHSLDDMCRICHGGEALSPELGQMISACACRGTVGRVHVKCLERWLTESGKSRCELCGTRYATRRVHRYGLPKAFVMWILSQNAKQLMVDSLGIMLMSPLAVLAAWLSGRTLAGLMTPESHVTPWPLASTFVLACMTLVCYYCWIVSAVTRHAFGWWIWYRSQYEVRLQIQENEE